MKDRKQTKGFTLIETLVAVTIFMIAIIAIYTFIVQGLQSTFFASRYTIATYLSQDGIEYVKHVRNSNGLNDNAEWLDGLGACVDKTCRVDTGILNPLENGAIEECGGGNCPALSYNEVINEYGYGNSNNGWEESPFTRSVTIQLIERDGTNEDFSAKIESSVVWTEKGEQKSVKITDYLTDW